MHKFGANRKIGEEDMQEQPRHPQGEDLASVKTVLIVGVELRLLEPSAREQSDPSNLSAFFGRRRQHAPQDFTQRLQDILEGPFDTVGSLQRAYKFQQLAASDLTDGQRLIDESEGGHSVDDEYLRACTGAISLSF